MIAVEGVFFLSFFLFDAVCGYVWEEKEEGKRRGEGGVVMRKRCGRKSLVSCDERI